MDKNRVKGAVDSAVGTAMRRVGKLTGNTGMQVRGAVQQAKGKVETVVGNLKDSARKPGNHSSSTKAAHQEVGRRKSSGPLA